jgi:hypothetical protein
MDPDDLTYDDVGDLQLVAALAGLRQEEEPSPEGFERRLASFLDQELRWRRPVRRLVHDRRAQVAAISLGGAILGAATVALWWRRSIRRRAVA